MREEVRENFGNDLLTLFKGDHHSYMYHTWTFNLKSLAYGVCIFIIRLYMHFLLCTISGINQ